MDTVQKFQSKSLKACIRNYTNIDAQIYFSEDSHLIIVSWKGNIPDEKTTAKIQNALRKFGKIIPNHFRDYNFVSFIID